MERLIDANELYVDARFGENEEPYISLYQINNAPTVDAETVKHGHWEYVKKRLARGGYVDASECSICHKIIMPHLKPNYCPNCGAKMTLD